MACCLASIWVNSTLLDSKLSRERRNVRKKSVVNEIRIARSRKKRRRNEKNWNGFLSSVLKSVKSLRTRKRQIICEIKATKPTWAKSSKKLWICTNKLLSSIQQTCQC